MRKKIMSFLLVTVLVFSLCSFPTVFAEENGTSRLQYKICQDIRKDKTQSSITLTLKEQENVLPEKIKLPDGKEVTENLETVTYSVTENGIYNFKVYYRAGDESKEETIKEKVTGIEQEAATEQTAETHPVNENADALSTDKNTWEVFSDADLNSTLDAIKEESATTDVTIILGKDNIKWKSPIGISGKHVTIKSTENNDFTLNVDGESVLQGDVTMDNIKLPKNDELIYANGYKFETTENFGGGKVGTIYGGGNQTDVKGDTNIILRGNISVSNVYGGGFDGNVNGDTTVLVDGTNVLAGNVYGGGHAKSTRNGKVSGNTNVSLRKGVNAFLFGGGMNEYSKDNAEGAREPASVAGTANVIVGYDGAPAHTIEFGTAMFAYGGSWHSTVGNVNFQMLDGAWSDKKHTSRSYFGCGYRDTVRGTVRIVVDGADLSNDRVYGGGDDNYPYMGDDYGPVEILNESKEQYALHISYKPSDNSDGVNAGSKDDIPTMINGNVLIEAQHGDMDFVVLDNESFGYCTIDGIATVRISANTNIAQVQGNKKHIDANMAEKSLAIYDGCGTKDAPQKTGYLYRFGKIILQNNAQVLVDSENFSQFESVQKPFYTVKDLEISKDCGLTTRDSSTNVQDSVKIDDGTWTALGYVYVDEKMESQNGHIFFNNYFAIGYKHRNDNNLTAHTAFLSKNDEFVALKSGYTGKFYGNVELDKSDLVFMCPVNVSGNWKGGNSLLRVPAVAKGENYDGTDNGGTIALNIDGLATEKTTVNTVKVDDWKQLQNPTLGDNYITGFTADKSTPIQDTFVLGNKDAVDKGYYLKRLADPADKEKYFMWQVAKKESYHVLYEFKSETADKELIDNITDLLPTDNKKYFEGSTITAIQPDETTIKVSDGVWTFKGYDADKKEAKATNADSKGNVKFIGTWAFSSNASVINEVPSIIATDKMLIVGDIFDPLKDVTAFDKEDGDLTDKIEVLHSNVDTSKAGVYEVTYKVTDSQGASCVKTITVTVKEKKIENTATDNNKKPDNNESGTNKKSKTNKELKDTDKEISVNTPKTGDNAGMGLWISFFALSGGVLAVVIGMRRKRKFEK